MKPRRVLRIYERLSGAYGTQHWWPGETPFEVMVGAVLTQNTAWTNVERAIGNLRSAGVLAPEPLAALPLAGLAALIRPAGYFNVKARRLHNFCVWYLEAGGFRALERWETAALRHALLGVNGVGPETADDILLYAFGRPVFVIDAYTRRLFRRLGAEQTDDGYETLRHWFESRLAPDVALYNEYHALIVHHAKHVCRSRPLCRGCCLARLCPSAGQAESWAPAAPSP